MTSRIEKRKALDSREGLLQELAAIDAEGWESERGERLLSYVRSHIVRPQVFQAGLRGLAADQAEATGWEVAWEAMTSATIRDAESPWGLLWVAVRRAVQGELMACVYLTNTRNSWRVRRAQEWTGGDPLFDPPVSLTGLIEEGWDRAEEPEARVQLGPRLEAVIGALVAVGWEKRVAHAVVEGVALTAVRNGKAATDAQGWRPLAAKLGLQPWRVRRVMVVLLGAPGWPGAMERMTTEGPGALEEEGMRAALRSTITSSWPTPSLAARQATAGERLAPMKVAS